MDPPSLCPIMPPIRLRHTVDTGSCWQNTAGTQPAQWMGGVVAWGGAAAFAGPASKSTAQTCRTALLQQHWKSTVQERKSTVLVQCWFRIVSSINSVFFLPLPVRADMCYGRTNHIRSTAYAWPTIHWVPFVITVC